MDRGYKAPFYIAWKADQKIEITIPDGCRLVVFTLGHPPSAVPNTMIGVGRFELWPETLPGGSFPMGFQAVDAAYISMIEGLSVEKSDAIFRQAIAMTAQGGTA